MYFEAYESMMSTFVQGLYTRPDIYDWNLDWHFLLFPLYARLNQYFPHIQVFGILLFLFDLFSLTGVAILLASILETLAMSSKTRLLLFTLLFAYIALDNIVNLGSTRLVFISLFGIFGWIEFRRINGMRLSAFNTVLITLSLLFLALIRMDAVFLGGSLYVVYLVLFRRFYPAALFPAFAGAAFLYLYMAVVMPSASPERKVYYYNELDVMDRNNVDYAHLSPMLSMEVQALREHFLFDKVHFSAEFYDRISRPEQGWTRMLNGLNLRYALNTFRQSAFFYLTSVSFILFSFFGFFLLFLYNRQARWLGLLRLLAVLLLPLGVCLYVITPSRFLVPYYTAAGCLGILLYLKHAGPDKKLFAWIAFVLLLQLFIEYKATAVLRVQQENFVQNSAKLQALSDKYKGLPVVIHMLDGDKFFPLDPFTKVERSRALFLNFYYFNAYTCYEEVWRSACHCDPLSLKAKIDYVVSAQCPFIISDQEFDFLQEYFRMKYHEELKRVPLHDFDSELRTCFLIYQK